MDIEALKQENEITLFVHNTGKGLRENFVAGGTSGFGIMLIKMHTEQLKGTYKIENDKRTKTIARIPVL
jgi:two-component sensor histidine kinase